MHVIRHGESEFNAATKYQPGFEDPQIYDPHLTTKGRTQVPATASFSSACKRLSKLLLGLVIQSLQVLGGM